MIYPQQRPLIWAIFSIFLCGYLAEGFLAVPLSCPASTKSKPLCLAGLSEADKDRLLVDEVGMTAFIVAEMEDFVNESMVSFDNNQDYMNQKWCMSPQFLVDAELASENGTITSTEYLQAVEDLKGPTGGAKAVEMLCNTTRTAFVDGFRDKGLLSSLGCAIMYFRNYYRYPALLAACERVGLSDYQVAHHITDMYHHRTFRGTYTKTLPASGKGEIAARIAVGLDVEEGSAPTPAAAQKPKASKWKKKVLKQEPQEEEDECLCWSPTTPGLCLKWKSEDEAWRKKRFERVQMEGTRDPRRGGSGTTR